jgi:hypothetical protein
MICCRDPQGDAILWRASCQIVKRTFSYAGVLTQAILAVLLSSIALYAALLCTLPPLCCAHLRGMGIAEDMLRVAHADFISEISLAFSSGHFRMAGKRLYTDRSAGISFSRLWNDFGCA